MCAEISRFGTGARVCSHLIKPPVQALVVQVVVACGTMVLLVDDQVKAGRPRLTHVEKRPFLKQ
jgi:hypothetical protein